MTKKFLFISVCLFLIPKVEAYHYGITHELFVPYGFKPLFRSKTMPFVYDEKFKGTQRETLIVDVANEINAELGRLAVLVHARGDGICKRNNGFNEICFGIKTWEFVDVFGEIEGPDMAAYCDARGTGILREPWLSSYIPEEIPVAKRVQRTEIYEADIFIGDSMDLEPIAYLRDVLKHEILHAFGFGHVKKGIMAVPAGVYGSDIEPKQLESWKELIKEKGGFHDIYPTIYLYD